MRNTFINVCLTLLLAMPSVAFSQVESLANDGRDAPEQMDLASLTKRADAGDPVATALLGFMYESGVRVKQDYAAALRLYLVAAEQGNALAQKNLGFMYFYGNGTKKRRHNCC